MPPTEAFPIDVRALGEPSVGLSSADDQFELHLAPDAGQSDRAVPNFSEWAEVEVEESIIRPSAARIANAVAEAFFDEMTE